MFHLCLVVFYLNQYGVGVCFLIASENLVLCLCILYWHNVVFVSTANSMTISSPKKGTIVISLFLSQQLSANDYDDDDEVS